MAQDIKRRIVLEGEKEYNSALKEIQRNQKTLRTELKASSAELGKNATAQQKAELRAISAAKQIKEQEKAVKTCEEALAKVKEEYADNEDVIAKWEQKLNDARATLAQMKDGLYDLGDGFKQTKSDAELTTIATKQVADAIGKIGDMGGSVSNAIEDIFTSMIDTMERAVSAVWNMISETAARSNNWTDLASYYGSSASEMQKWNNAVSASKGNFQDLVQLINTFSFGGKNQKITEWFGISDANYQDNLAYTVAVLGQMAEMKDRMVEAGTWDQAMTDIFGARKAQNASWFISNWDTITGELDKFDAENGGFGLSGEELETMNQVAIKTAEIETMWKSIEDTIATAFGPHVLSLETNVTGGLDAINRFLKAENEEEREQALADLRTNVEEFFTKVGDILREGIRILGEVGEELQQSDDPVVSAIGGILTALKDALEWIVNNQGAVETAFEAIFAICLMGHLAKAGAKLAEILLQIKAIQAFNGANLSGAAGAAGAASAAGAEGAAATAAAAEATTTAGTPVSGFMKFMSTLGLFNIAKGASEQLGTGLYGEWYKRNNYEEAKKSGAIRELAYTKDGWVDVYEWEKAHPGEELERLPPPEIKKEEEPLKRSGHSGSFGEDEEDALKEQERIQQASGPKRKKNIIGTATEEQMQTRPPEQTTEEAVTEAMQTVAVAVPETMEGLLDALYEHINDYDPETNQLNTTDFFDQVLYPMIQKAAELGGVTGDDADAIADLIYDKWIQSMYDEEWEGSTSGILNILEEAIEEAAAAPTQAQKDAAEAFWDLYRETGDLGDKRFDALEEQFEGADELFDKLMEAVDKLYDSAQGDEWRDIEDLPANWWMDAEAWMRTGSENNGITSGDLANFRSLPGSVAAAVKSGAAQGVSGIKVYLDGVEVGRLVAPYVSETIARDVIM